MRRFHAVQRLTMTLDAVVERVAAFLAQRPCPSSCHPVGESGQSSGIGSERQVVPRSPVLAGRRDQGARRRFGAARRGSRDKGVAGLIDLDGETVRHGRHGVCICDDCDAVTPGVMHDLYVDGGESLGL